MKLDMNIITLFILFILNYITEYIIYIYIFKLVTFDGWHWSCFCLFVWIVFCFPGLTLYLVILWASVWENLRDLVPQFMFFLLRLLEHRAPSSKIGGAFYCIFVFWIFVLFCSRILSLISFCPFTIHLQEIWYLARYYSLSQKLCILETATSDPAQDLPLRTLLSKAVICCGL